MKPSSLLTPNPSLLKTGNNLPHFSHFCRFHPAITPNIHPAYLSRSQVGREHGTRP